MRLLTSVLAAAALHGVVFGVAAAVFSPTRTVTPAPATVEVEVVPPKPEPVIDSPSAARASLIPSDTPKAQPPRWRRERQPPRRAQVAVVEHAAVSDPTALSSAPSASSPGGPAVPHGSVGAVLSAKPRYRSNPAPEYPIPSKRRHEEGIVLLNVVVQPDGLPAAVALARSCGHPLLDRAALDAVRRWTFEPARAAGVPVSSLVAIPVRFFLSDQP